MPINYTHRDPRRSQPSAEQSTPEPPKPASAATGIDYTRRNRLPRHAAAATQSPAPSVAPVAVEPSRPTRHKSDKPAKQVPVLVSAAEQLTPLRRAWQEVADDVGSTVRTMLADFLASHRNTRATSERLRACEADLIEAYTERFGHGPGRAGNAAIDPETWCDHAEEITSRLRTQRIPFTDKGRAAVRNELSGLVSPLLGQYEATLRSYLESEWRNMVSRGESAAKNVRAQAIRSLPLLPPPPPPVGAQPRPISQDIAYAPGPGPIQVHFGDLRATSLEFHSASAQRHATGQHTLAVPNVELPLIIDLDAAGSILTTDRQCLEGPLLNLLCALPANQLLIRIFDPEHGGNSAKFLYNLGDAADKIIGERVKTTERELSDLLQDTEEHITFVTQRFLQGEHKTLTAYNHAAGEVAEPYRVLVLYDFPSGFSRGGHPDVDILERVGKIIRNGPRTGVFTFLVCKPQDSELLNQEHYRKIVASVPWLGGQLTADTLTKIQAWPLATKILWNVPTPPPHSSGAAIAGPANLAWTFVPGRPPNSVIAASLIEQIRRNLHSANDVRVTPTRVAELAGAAQKADAALTGLRLISTVADPSDESTWWRATSETAVVGAFGRIGARQVANLRLDSEVDTFAALIGGRPGSGKSVLLHAAIMSIATSYSPEEVELFLIDFKEGVEFKQYADDGLPHARVIAIESERDFGLSVLRAARAEIKRRGADFRDIGGGAVKLEEYRSRSGQRLKRWILIIDEFQQLFYRDDKIAAEAAEILEQVLRLGRAFGVHIVLASQSLAGMASLGKHVLGFIPTRIALQSNESDSRLLLGDDNPDAQTLTRAGEGILNNKGGLKDANQRFQAAFWSPEDRSAVLQSMTRRARRQGLPAITTVFAGHEAAQVDSVSFDLLVPSADPRDVTLTLPAGLPSTLDARPVSAMLRRESGSHLLIVDDAGPGPLTAICGALHTQSATTELLDFMGDDEDWKKIVTELGHLRGLTVHPRRTLPSVLGRVAGTVDQRHKLSDFRATPIVVAVSAMGRARDFDPNNSSYGDNNESVSDILRKILRDGPEVGVHVVVWFDRAAGINKRLDSTMLAEFGQRLVGRLSRDDSGAVIDSDSAAELKPGQAILADLDRGTEHRVRKFATPPVEWITGLSSRAARS